ncbi:sulfatase/phosphatase domain-containing protein [Aeoliella mucimassa]|uniref:Arylsulfatase n=1 Tax=Aeoliella mucimassa TaxID=2527972 RepID=A0A518AVD3_9BACT|nr:sulfatase/phosphatase domain-containing protein [Aeoliella mucimassa]QDU58695.1 Arylsulfatase [Aeoliella mucimassa]
MGEQGQVEHDYLYWEFYEQGGKQAIRKGKWKGVVLNTKSAPVFELYDLEADPSETTDLAQQHPEIVEQLKSAMQEAHTDSELVSLFSKAKAKRGNQKNKAR